MTKLRLGPIEDKPVKLSVELAAPLHRRLVAYAEALALQEGQSISDPAKLVPPMLEHFMATDRVFSRGRKRD
jgi:hypothetical protein